MRPAALCVPDHSLFYHPLMRERRCYLRWAAGPFSPGAVDALTAHVPFVTWLVWAVTQGQVLAASGRASLPAAAVTVAVDRYCGDDPAALAASWASSVLAYPTLFEAAPRALSSTLANALASVARRVGHPLWIPEAILNHSFPNRFALAEGTAALLRVARASGDLGGPWQRKDSRHVDAGGGMRKERREDGAAEEGSALLLALRALPVWSPQCAPELFRFYLSLGHDAWALLESESIPRSVCDAARNLAASKGGDAPLLRGFLANLLAQSSPSPDQQSQLDTEAPLQWPEKTGAHWGPQILKTIASDSTTEAISLPGTVGKTPRLVPESPKLAPAPAVAAHRPMATQTQPNVTARATSPSVFPRDVSHVAVQT